jgi:hypothetical protein
MIPRRAARSLSIGKNRATNPDFPFLAAVQSVSSKCQAPGYLLRKGCLGSCKLQRRSHQVEQKHSNLFQPLFPIESPMHIASIPRYHGEALFPLRKKMPFQKVVRRNQIIDSRQAQLLHQTVLQRPKLSLDASFGLRTGAPIHSVPSSRKARPNCERASSPRSCSCKAAAPLRWRKMLCLSVQCADGRPYRCNQPPNMRRFSSVVSCATKRAHSRLLASSITAINEHPGARSANHRNGELSCITNSPKHALFTCCARGRHNCARVIHFRSVSRLTWQPSSAKCSATSVGPKSAYLWRIRAKIFCCNPVPACGSRAGHGAGE